MKLAIYQVIVPALALIFIARTTSQFRRGDRTGRELVATIGFWMSACAIAIFPEFVVQNVEKFTGLRSGVTGILFLAVLILGMLVVFLVRENERRTEEIAKISRFLAMKFSEKK